MVSYTYDFMVKLKYITTIVVALVISPCSMYGIWEPGYQLKYQERLNTHGRASPGLNDLRTSVEEWLTGSWCSKERGKMLMDAVFIFQPRTTVEVGVFAGASLVPLALAVRQAKCGTVYAFDAWDPKTAAQYMEPSNPTHEWWSTLDMDSVHDQCIRSLSRWNLDDCVRVIRGASAKVSGQVAGPIDLLHLDGDFTEKGSLEDVDTYLPKLRVGGCLVVNNAFVKIGEKLTKAKCVQKILDCCELIGSADHDNALFFIKTGESG
ncbi:MAG: class I SAM-dependent methyltransferase [Chlamydiia bacterium]